MNPFDALLPDAPPAATSLRMGVVAQGGAIVFDGESTATAAIGAQRHPAGRRVVIGRDGRRTYVLAPVNAASFDPSRSLYAPDGTTTGWRNRVLAAKYGRVTNIAVIGSSSVAGVGATTVHEGWGWLLRERFEDAGYPIQGSGLAMAGCAKLIADPMWTFSASGVTVPGDGTFLPRSYVSLDNGAWAQYDSDVAGTRVRVYYLNDGGPFTVSIDGGSATTVTPTSTNETLSWTSGTLSDTTHTVRVTATSATPALVAGVEVFDLTATGISVTVAGISGTTSNSWYSPLHGFNLGTVMARLPALAVVAVNGNDYTLSVDRDVIRSRYATMIAAMRFVGCQPLLTIMPHIQQHDLDGYREHASVLYEVADVHGVPLIDMVDRWGSYTEADRAGLFADGIHPSQRGHELYADAIFNVLTS